jgi:hypothetical protein
MFRKVFYCIALMIPLLLSGDNTYSSLLSQGTSSQRRIAFRIASIEENKGARRVISLTTVEGAPGTDFDINLQGGRFQMNAHFFTDLIARDTLKMRARLDTRRLYGYSERNLPLFEEDNQRETLDMSFDEAIVLFPFGSNGGDDRLKIEITPSWSDETSLMPSGELRPLAIKIQQPSPGSAVSVHASKTPHRFNVEASLLKDGHEVASGASDCLIEEQQELVLQSTGEANELTKNFVVNFALSNYVQAPSTDQIQIDFDLYRPRGQNAREAIASKWSGIASFGSPFTYDLSNTTFGSGNNYQLRFKINLAAGEKN